MNKKIINRQKVNNILNTLANNWDGDSSNFICNSLGEPPYIDSICGYFSSSFMKKPKEDKKTVVDKRKTAVNESVNKSYAKKY